MSNRHPADHATNLAIDIIAEAHRYSYAEAVEIIAVRLRSERAKGHAEGLVTAMEPLKQFGIAAARRIHEHQMRRETLFTRMGADDTQADHNDTVLAGHPGFAGVGA